MEQPVIVHSFWSKPALEIVNSEKVSLMNRKMGGWVDKKYFYMSWALSCLSFKKLYDEVNLITDKNGITALIEKLNLPYSNVEVCLDKLNNQSKDLWATSKLYSYREQTKSFLHVDGDVFSWKRFDKKIEDANLVSQNIEIDFECYKKIWHDIKSKIPYIPSFVLDDFKKNKKIVGANAGVFGGQNLEFINEFVNEVLLFLKRNKRDLSKIDLGYAGLIYEQYFFSCFARQNNQEISYVFEKMDEEYTQAIDFKNIAQNTKYIHVVGDAKKKLECCVYVENQLLLEYPNYYYQIMELINKNEL